MRERTACVFLGIVLVVTIIFFSIAIEETKKSVSEFRKDIVPTVMINGQLFIPGYNDLTGRMTFVVDQDDLSVGDNMVEIQWGSEQQSTMTAELSSDLQQL